MKIRNIVLAIALGVLGFLVSLAFGAGSLTSAICALVAVIIGMMVRFKLTKIDETSSETNFILEDKKPEKDFRPIDILTLVETVLLMSEKDIKIMACEIDKNYFDLFAPYVLSHTTLPGVDSIFDESLNKTDGSVEPDNLVRVFNLKKDGHCPMVYFWSLGVNLSTLALSSKMIMRYFISNYKELGGRNWFIWNTKPQELNVIEDNLRFIDIVLLSNNKYCITSYPFERWNSWCGGWLKKEDNNKFIIKLS